MLTISMGGEGSASDQLGQSAADLDAAASLGGDDALPLAAHAHKAIVVARAPLCEIHV